MARFVRELILKELKDRLQGHTALFLVNYQGLSAAKAVNVRQKLSEKGAKFLIVKNSLAQIALKEVGITGLDGYLKGSVAVVYGGDEPAVVAKTLLKWCRDNRQMAVLGGCADGMVLDEKGVTEFSKLPTKSELYAMIAGAVVGNLSGIAGCLNNLIGGVAAAVEALREKKAKEPAA